MVLKLLIFLSRLIKIAFLLNKTMNIFVLQQRNKPKEPPKVPKAAPFFLPTVPGLELMFAKPADDVEQDKVFTERRKILFIFLHSLIMVFFFNILPFGQKKLIVSGHIKILNRRYGAGVFF